MAVRKPDLARARDALRAWCSIPDSKNAKPKEAWQYETDFRQLHGAFPELVDEQGNGWFVRHVHGVRDFLKRHPEKVSKPALKNLEPLSHGWDRDWRDKVIRFQIPLFSPETKGGWVLRFDDILADALELGPLRSPTILCRPAWNSGWRIPSLLSNRRCFSPCFSTMWRTSRRTPPGWCCPWPALTPTSAPPPSARNG